MNTISIIRDNRPIRNKWADRPRNARVALSLLVLIFLGTSGFAFILAPTAESPSRAYSVTATVIQPARSVTSPTSPTSSLSASSTDATMLEKTILSDANLKRAIQLISSDNEQHEKQYQDQSGSIAGESLEKLRRKLSVTSTDIAASGQTTTTHVGQVEISITYSGRGNPRQACRLVDILAAQAARQNTIQRETAARIAHQNSQKAANQARVELFKARADYDAFLSGHFTNGHFTSKLSSTPPAARPTNQPAPGTLQAGPLSPDTLPPGPLPPGTSLSQPTPGLDLPRTDWTETPESPTLNNPRWIELNNKLSRLMNRRAELLVRMTPAHPEVQNVDLEIENLERLISSVPRELARPGRDSLPPITPMPPDPTDDLLAPGGEGRANRILANEPRRKIATPAELHPRLAKIFREKQKKLDVAQQKYNRLNDLERAAWEKISTVQPAEVIPATCPENSSESYPPDAVSNRSVQHLLVSLIIGLCGAAGIGMFSAGVSPPPSFANAAEVRNSLKVPVVGSMPAADLPGTDADRLARPSINRLALAASGMIFLIVSVAIIIIMFTT